MGTTIRTREQAVKDYVNIRSRMSLGEKRVLAKFEGQQFFRFGNSWRRLSFDGLSEVILFDGEDYLRVT